MIQLLRTLLLTKLLFLFSGTAVFANGLDGFYKPIEAKVTETYTSPDNSELDLHIQMPKPFEEMIWVTLRESDWLLTPATKACI